MAVTEVAVTGVERGVPQFEQNFPLAGLPHSEQYMAHTSLCCLPSIKGPQRHRDRCSRWPREFSKTANAEKIGQQAD
jgi:hypothetical protein